MKDIWTRMASTKSIEKRIKMLPEIYKEITSIHPACLMVPVCSKKEFDLLVEGIKTDGLLHNLIVNSEGALIDGKLRLLACYDARVEPRYEVNDADPFVISSAANLQRRHIQDEVKAMNTLPILASKINELHERAQGYAKSAVQCAIDCGQRLIEAKAMLSHGEFLPWLEANCEVGERQARRYMKVAANRTRVSDFSSLREALAALDPPKANSVGISQGPVFHELAEMIPMMTNAELDELTESIREHGLMHPITLYEGKILDGRCRYIACLRSGVRARFVELGKDQNPFSFLISMNIRRHHFESDEERASHVAAALRKVAQDRA